MPRLIPIPRTPAELLQNFDRIVQAIESINALLEMQVHLVQPGTVKPLQPGNKTLVGDAPNIILPVPLQWPAPVADALASTASNTAAINAMLANLRLTRQNPS